MNKRQNFVYLRYNSVKNSLSSILLSEIETKPLLIAYGHKTWSRTQSEEQRRRGGG